MDETWTKRGEFGRWTSPTGRRCWLYPSDYPMSIGGVALIVRVVEPTLVQMFNPSRRDIWVAVVGERGPFQHVSATPAGEGLDVRVELEVRCWWAKRGNSCA